MRETTVEGKNGEDDGGSRRLSWKQAAGPQ